MTLNEQRKRSIIDRLNYKISTYREGNSLNTNQYESLINSLNRLGIKYTQTGNISKKGLKSVSLQSLKRLETIPSFNQIYQKKLTELGSEDQVNKSLEIEQYLNQNKEYIYGGALKGNDEAVWLLNNMYSTGVGKGLRNQSIDRVYTAIQSLRKDKDVEPSVVFGRTEWRNIGERN